ncbi:MAG TPA: hypothetical protein VGK64_23400 [Bryobacteraceae bacterium]
MRYWIIFLLGVFSAAAQTPTVTITGTDGLSHSVVRVKFNVSSNYSALRTRYIAAPGSCTSGTGGTVQTSTSNLARFTSGMANVIGGLTPNTTYQICPEVTTDGVNWSTGAGVTVTTLPLPAVHPALPIAPATFNTNYPDTTGYNTVTVASDCSDLQSRIDGALAVQATTGTIIQIPAGTVCSQPNIQFARPAADIVQFQPSAINTSTGAININNHGLTEGQMVTFGKQYGSLSSFPASSSCEFGNGLIEGQTYTVHVIDANNFRIYCPDKSTLMTFANQGNVTNYFALTSFPRKLKWIIIRSATPDSQLPPEHTRITPAWLPKMASLVDPVVNVGNSGGSGTFISFGDTDGNNHYMVSNIRIGPGIEITTADSPEAHQSSDPLPWFRLIFCNTWNSNIVFDRTYIHGQGTPNRMTADWFWNGTNMGLVDSYLSNLTYFHPMYTGLTATKTSGTTFTIAPGVENMGGGPVSLPAMVTGTISGSGSGRAFVYFDMANSNAFTVSVPPNIGVSCSGATCASAAAGSNNGTCNYSDGWPKDSSNNPTAGLIACVDISGGAISGVSNADPATSRWNTEGSSFMIGGVGPGPYVATNNWIEGAGLVWHHDDGGGTAWIRGDYNYTRNTFKTPFKYMYGGSESDGLRYFLRQPLEWKSGRRISLFGNIFDGAWVEVTPASVFIAFTSVAGQGITDVDLQNNTFMHGPGITNVPTLVDGGAVLTPPPVRFRFKNNLAWDIGSSAYWVPQGGAGAPTGWLFEGPQGGEDVIVDHNTIAGNTGRGSAVFWLFDTNVEGVKVTNNFLYLSSNTQGVAQDGSVPANACFNLFGKALADCKFTPNYTWANNVMMSPDASQATVQSWWPSLHNYIPSDMSLNSAGWLSYSKKDFHVTSKYCSGCSSPATDSRDVGADIDVLQAAQGKVTLIGVPEANLTSTSAVVSFVAPDSMGCPVDYSASDPNVITSFTRVSDGGGARSRNITLSGLTPGTVYHYRVNCAVEQPTGQFRTR